MKEITFDPGRIRQQLRQRLSRAEFFALAFCILVLVGLTVVLNNVPPFGYDYYNLMSVAAGNLHSYYYAYWGLPAYDLLHLLPLQMSFILWGLLNISGVWFAARVFGGNLFIALISYQMLFILFYGQVAGVIVGGVALLWWAMAEKWWLVAGLGMIIAVTKFQTGIPFSLAVWLLADVRWLERLKVLVVPIAAALVSLLIYPLWPIQLLNTLTSNPPHDAGSLSLWRWIGPLALLIWIPTIGSFFSANTARVTKIVLVVTASALALPYFQQADLVILYVLPIGWFGLLGNFGYLYFIYDIGVWQALGFVPLLVYIRTLWQFVQQRSAASRSI